MWPAARNNDEYQQTVKEMLVAKSNTLTGDALSEGYRMLVRSARTSRDDGGPAWPPSPGEVMGCVLTAARDLSPSRPLPRRGLRRVRGHVCRKCSGPVDFHPGEEVLHCAPCNTVMGVKEGIRLSWDQVQGLEFADTATVDPAAAAEAKERAMAFIRSKAKK